MLRLNTFETIDTY